ncbi:MAG: Gfo/Idh/MocA family oxidoreductase [Kiritimatiellia bacterium]|nr:Gfo/Idh/MocA family oxidoreductase [Kiritimatiellia bacterium]
MKRTKVGVIGCGPRSQGSTIKNILNIKEYQLTAISDKYEPLMRKTVEVHKDKIGDVKLYRDSSKMLKEADIDAAFVVVEPENNAALVCESLSAGKHTYCDVPLAMTLEDCWRIVVAVEKSGLKFMLGEQSRYSPKIQAWTRMVREGRLGKIVYAQGEYLHGMGADRYFMDAETGERIHYAEAFKGRKSVKSRFWKLKHPIHYLPHELSPLLKVIDDRVTRVSCIGTRSDKSYVYDWFPMADMEVALMHTEKDVLMRMAAGFTIDTMKKGESNTHWKHVMGTKGVLEQGRDPRSMEGQVYLEDEFMSPSAPARMTWEFNPREVSREILASGHGGIDYWPYNDFSKWLLDDKYDTAELLTVYKAAETAAPAALAGLSAENKGEWFDVPDFRPGKNRKKGQMPSKED